MVQWVLSGGASRVGSVAGLPGLAAVLLGVLPALTPNGSVAAFSPSERSAAEMAATAGDPEPAELTVIVEGVDGSLRDNVLAFLSIQERDGQDVEEGEVRRMHRRAEAEIREALVPFGYYNPDVELDLARDDGVWRAWYRVDPGSPVILQEVDIRLEGEGADDPVLRDAVDRFPLEEGDPVNHQLYDQGRQELDAVVFGRGYFEAAFTQRRVEVDAEAEEGRIALHLETGPRFRFGPVTFQQEEFSEELLEGFVPFREGEPYEGARLLELQNALMGAGLFQSVEVDARPREAVDDQVPVVVLLTPRPRTRVDVGGGYGTDTGPRGSLAWEIRRLNRHGHQLDGELRGSFSRRDIRTRYIIPFGGPGERIALTAGYRDDDREGHRGRSVLFGISVSQDRWGWRETASVDFHRSWFRVGEVEGLTTLVLPGVEWSRVRADDRLHPRRGHRLSVELRGTEERIGSHVSFGQVTLRGGLVRPVGDQGRFLSRAALGFTEVDDFDRLPGLFRYFAGGDRSVRGFGFQSLGERDEEGRVRGGRHLVVGSVEYEHVFGEVFDSPWGGAVFYDTGNAMNRFRDGLEQGAGVGLRWLSPIGMVRFDVATGLSRSGWPIRLHLTVGGEL